MVQALVVAWGGGGGKCTHQSLEWGVEKWEPNIQSHTVCPLIITGGGAELILPILDLEYIYNENLSFMGLKYIYEQENNKK